MPINQRPEPWKLFWCSPVVAVDPRQSPPLPTTFDWFVLADTSDAASRFIAKYEGVDIEAVKADPIKTLTAPAQAAIEESGVEPDTDECFGYPSLLILDRAGAVIEHEVHPRYVWLPSSGQPRRYFLEGDAPPSVTRQRYDRDLEAAYQSGKITPR
jgi:hypothetical protein